MSACFFIGHRDAPESIYPALAAEVERHIVEYGVNEFIVGQYGRFDTMAARAVREAKTRHPQVRLILLLAYHPSDRKVHTEGFDSTFYPPLMDTIPRRFAIVRANQFVVILSNFLIAYAWQPGSNARNLVQFARKQEKKGQIQITLLDPS